MTPSLTLRFIWQLLAWLSLVAAIMAAPARADTLERGQLGVTRFSGLASPGVAPSPIDLNGVSFVTLDVGQEQGGRLGSRMRFRLSAGDIGQVFGMALDDGRTPDGHAGSPNVYLTATSAYGLRIVGGNAPLTRGRPDAAWMPGQFGTARGGGPGAVWKVDGRTGEVALLATITAFGLETGAASLGAIAFDPASRMLYVSSLETGFIHRIGLDGTDFGYFDHGVEGRVLAEQPAIAADPGARRDPTHPQFEPQNPASWGFAPRERLVHGLAVHRSRLYYAVAEGPQIWSVGLNPDGSFGGDARAEIIQTGTAAESFITEIAFDAVGTLYFAERVSPGMEAAASADGRNPSAVRRFTLIPNADGTEHFWTPAAERIPGGWDVNRLATSGGFALGYGQDAGGAPNPAACEGSLWVTIGAARIGGEGGPPSLQRFTPAAPGGAGPVLADTAEDDTLVADRPGVPALGLVKAYAPCAGAAATGGPGQPWIDASNRGPLLFLEQNCKPCPVGGSCTCRVGLQNRGRETASGEIGFRSAATILSGPRMGELRGVRQTSPDGAQWNCRWLNTSEYDCRIDGGSLRPGARRYVDLLIDTRDLVEEGNFGLQNCATLLTQGGQTEGQQVCAQTGLDISVAETGPRRCVVGQPCRSETTISNLTTVPFDGEVKVTHFVALPGKGNLGGTMTINPPLECQPSEPPASPLECVARMSLAPGEKRTYEIAATYLGGTEPVRGVLCATVTDDLLDISKLLPGLPPVPLVGPGYHCRAFRLLPEGSSVADGGGQGQGGQGQTGQGGGAGQGQGGQGQGGQGQPGQSGGGGGQTPGQTGQGGASGQAGGQCPPGTIQDGTQCACPRGAKWSQNSCVADSGGGAGQGGACADGSVWNGVSCVPRPGTGGANVTCKPPFTMGAKGCACPERTKWTGLRCAPAVDYESPTDYGGLGGAPATPQPGQPTGPAPAKTDDTVDYGGMSGPPCPDGQVRDAGGKCVCPPYLEQVVENGQQICCLVPCPPGMKRENAQCVPDVKPTPAPTPPIATPTPPQCPTGWAGVHPNCCRPGLIYANGRCETPPPARCENGMVGTPPNCACPPGTNGVYPVCCPAPALYVNGRCERPVAPPPPPPPLISCRSDMIGSPPNCRCPQGAEDNGRNCVRIRQPECRRDMIGTPPNCFCPEGTRDNGSRCVTVTRPQCRSDMIGTPPNCFCPEGTRDNGSRCVRLPPPPCPPGMVGSPPNCACPTGTQFIGGRCVRRVCDPGWSGAYPTCCPPGTRYVNGACQRPAPPPPPPPPCRYGMVGTPPNCVCPPGTRFVARARRCLAITTPPPPPPTPCRLGMVGTPPNCACPPGTRFVARARRCLTVTSPTPTPTPTQPKCPLTRTCVQWGKAPPGALAGPCIRYETRPNCPVIVR